ncbi:MAG TPA: response regulator [Terriglobia bacterium]|nr:response regulator [Terriglobia bacterium]
MSALTTPPNHGIEILIAQDNITQAERLKLVLENRGHAVIVAMNGTQALAAARARKPTLIVIDMVSPEMDGYELCKQLKAEKELKYVPAILMTSLTSPEEVVKGLECGADIFIRKPYDEAAFISRIDYALSNRKLREREKVDVSLQISMGGKIHKINSAPQQVLDLLISTYEDATRINAELIERQIELGRLAAGLEKEVGERTAALRAEFAERQVAIEQLRQSEEQFRLIAENIGDLIAVLDLEGKRLYNSPSYKDILGDPAALRGSLSFNEIHPEDRERIMDVFKETVRTGRGQRTEYRFLLGNGNIRYIESQGSVIPDEKGNAAKVIVVSRDVTERNHLEERLRQAEKMEAVGQLAGGVAHDFNNLLTIINGYGDILLEQLAPDDKHRGYVMEIVAAGRRAESLTRQLLAFSRQQVLAPVLLDLNAAVKNMDKMLRRLIGEDVDLVTVASEGLWNVKADPGQIEQVIMNLAVNARDAMPKGGKLTIETANVDLDESYSRAHALAKPGPHVMIAVSDTGEGMTAQTQSRIFEPFFTTKGPAQGTGLGLSTVFGIVKQSKGHIWVYSELGAGTTFKIYLPRVDEALVQVEPVLAQPDLRPGSETVLLVEDEEAVRILVRRVLESSGYHVLEARHGAEALVICDEHKDPIQMLMTDVIMPEMSGRQLADRLSPHRPEMKVLYMSGYTDNAVTHRGILEPGTNFLQKPFTPVNVLRKVRAVLDGNPSA